MYFRTCLAKLLAFPHQVHASVLCVRMFMATLFRFCSPEKRSLVVLIVDSFGVVSAEQTNFRFLCVYVYPRVSLDCPPISDVPLNWRIASCLRRCCRLCDTCGCLTPVEQPSSTRSRQRLLHQVEKVAHVACRSHSCHQERKPTPSRFKSSGHLQWLL